MLAFFLHGKDAHRLFCPEVYSYGLKIFLPIHYPKSEVDLTKRCKGRDSKGTDCKTNIASICKVCSRLVCDRGEMTSVWGWNKCGQCSIRQSVSFACLLKYLMRLTVSVQAWVKRHWRATELTRIQLLLSVHSEILICFWWLLFTLSELNTPKIALKKFSPTQCNGAKTCWELSTPLYPPSPSYFRSCKKVYWRYFARKSHQFNMWRKKSRCLSVLSFPRLCFLPLVLTCIL